MIITLIVIRIFPAPQVQQLRCEDVKADDFKRLTHTHRRHPATDKPSMTSAGKTDASPRGRRGHGPGPGGGGGRSGSARRSQIKHRACSEDVSAPARGQARAPPEATGSTARGGSVREGGRATPVGSVGCTAAYRLEALQLEPRGFAHGCHTPAAAQQMFIKAILNLFNLFNLYRLYSICSIYVGRNQLCDFSTLD